MFVSSASDNFFSNIFFRDNCYRLSDHFDEGFVKKLGIVMSKHVLYYKCVGSGIIHFVTFQ